MSLINEGVKLIYVFDGVAPELKKKTWEKRKEIKDEMKEKYEKAVEEEDVEAMSKYSRANVSLDAQKIYESKELLSAMGIAIIQAPGEGEAQASYFAKQGKVYAVASQDYDCLMFKAPLLIQNLSLARRRKTISGYREVFPQVIQLNSVLTELEINQEQLICMGILCGTDYNPGGIKGLGPKKSLKIVQEFKTKEAIFDALENDEKFEKLRKASESFNSGGKVDFDWIAIYNEIEEPNVDKDVKIEFGKIDKEKIKEILRHYEFSEERIDSQLSKLDELKKKQGQKTLFTY
jgi:flap endonuclease-1